ILYKQQDICISTSYYSYCYITVQRDLFIFFHPLQHFFFHSLRPLLRNYFTISIIREKRLLLLFIRLHFLKFVTLPLFPLYKTRHILLTSILFSCIIVSVVFVTRLIRRRSSAGESARFIPVRSWVQIPPPLFINIPFLYKRNVFFISLKVSFTHLSFLYLNRNCTTTLFHWIKRKNKTAATITLQLFYYLFIIEHLQVTVIAILF